MSKTPFLDIFVSFCPDMPEMFSLVFYRGSINNIHMVAETSVGGFKKTFKKKKAEDFQNFPKMALFI